MSFPDSIQSNSDRPPLTNSFGIYVHIPFCVHRCSYCDFYSSARFTVGDFERLVDGICRELQSAARWLRESWGAPAPVRSVFLGGGTPSLLPVSQLARIFGIIGAEFLLAPDAELTMEANPETVTRELCEGMRKLTPINRVSLGAQSFRPENLRTLERLGSPESTERAVARLREAGYGNFNLDLIFAIPDQDRNGMLSDILSAANLHPTHLSAYQLTLKPGHPLFDRLPGEERSIELYEAGIAALESLGFTQYEISNYSRPGFESRHNLLYWEGGDYLGVGPSAASRFFWNGRFYHRKQVADLGRYLGQQDFSHVPLESTTWGQTVLEASFLGLRVNRGVEPERFRSRYGYDLRTARKFEQFCFSGLLVQDAGRIRLSAKGRLLADSVTEELVDLSPNCERAPNCEWAPSYTDAPAHHESVI